jgi:predicted Rossmann fold flavoprotein
MGHTIMPVLPSLVQLKCNDAFCKALAGIRCEAWIHIYAGEQLLCEERGEVQLTDYGISGIPVFQLSGLVNRKMYEAAKNKNKNQGKGAEFSALIDFLPDISIDDLHVLLEKRLKSAIYKSGTVEEFFTGVLNKKLMLTLMKIAGINPSQKVVSLEKDALFEVLYLCKNLKMHITGSNGYDNAQVCTGGVSMLEVTENLESLKGKGIYFAGEILDVDGRCGGYNLQWAWTSGAIAGQAASK